ncbi:hypothetical protein BU15DRAFT_78047 [Melanogaster broomeanus]|nr:hypothetical protein BU15DRAFT_78047 [Melanogaster broomeanus]
MKRLHVLTQPVPHSFAPAHVLNASPLDTSISTVIGINAPCVTPLNQDTSPASALFVPPADPPAAVTANDEDLLIECSPRPSPQTPEENPDPDILIDRRRLTSPILVSTAEQAPPDLIVTTSVEVSTSPSNPVEEASIEE